LFELKLGNKILIFTPALMKLAGDEMF